MSGEGGPLRNQSDAAAARALASTAGADMAGMHGRFMAPDSLSSVRAGNLTIRQLIDLVDARVERGRRSLARRRLT